MLTDEEKSNWWNATPWNADLKTRIFAYAEFIERAVIAAYEAKLLNQMPVGIARRVYSPGYRIEELPDSILKDGMELFEHPAPIPEGWQLVPVEPTEAMIDKVLEERMDALINGTEHTLIDIYNAMLAAARSEKCCQ